MVSFLGVPPLCLIESRYMCRPYAPLHVIWAVECAGVVIVVAAVDD